MADTEIPEIRSKNALENKILSQIPGSDIDDGRFKYVLIKVTDKSCKPNAFKYIVRGYKWGSFHADIYEKIEEDFAKQYPDIHCSCPGGGRIIHDSEKKKITVFGYSQGYGRPDHRISVEVLKEKYTDYTIDWSDEGY